MDRRVRKTKGDRLKDEVDGQGNCSKSLFTSNVCFFKERFFYIMCAGILALKCLLIPAYHSTDFEVHRNWMAVTSKLPLEKWYYENTSEWTLDYPPFFAYFEFLLSQVAQLVVPEALVLQKEPFFSNSLLVFHRFSVIATDLLFVLSSVFVAKEISTLFGRDGRRSAVALCTLLVCNVSLIMVDNIHFQYNAFLTSFLLFSIAFTLKRRWLLGAFCFCVLLNAKHIYVYYAAAYVLFFARMYIFSSTDLSVIWRSVKLAVTLIVPFLLSFGPFVYRGGIGIVSQILSRLFPFQRGLTHAFWAPNIWALYNFADFSLFHSLKLLKKLPTSAISPQYTSGLVQEYSHSVLPSVSPLGTIVVTLVLLSPLLMFLRRPNQSGLLLLLTHSAFAFFLAGYHVHEKAIILVTIPYTLLAVMDHRFLPSFVVLSSVANISLFPLFFTPFESIMKVVLAIFYHGLCEGFMNYLCEGRYSLGFYRVLYLRGLLLVQLYTMLLHSVVFGKMFEFLPLMLTSVCCAIGLVACFVELLIIGYSGSASVSSSDKQKSA